MVLAERGLYCRRLPLENEGMVYHQPWPQERCRRLGEQLGPRGEAAEEEAEDPVPPAHCRVCFFDSTREPAAKVASRRWMINTSLEKFRRDTDKGSKKEETVSTGMQVSAV